MAGNRLEGCFMVKKERGERNNREAAGGRRKLAGGEGNHGCIPEPGGDVWEGAGFDTEV